MINEFNKICWHDATLVHVEEDVAFHQLIWFVELDTSSNCYDSKYEQRKVIFHDVYHYSVIEGVVSGGRTLLDFSIKEYSNECYSGYMIEFGTTGGKRVICASNFTIS